VYFIFFLARVNCLWGLRGLVGQIKSIGYELSVSATAEYGGGFNRSMQHTENCVSRWSVADEVPDAKLLYR